jgi:hypothetical protein
VGDERHAGVDIMPIGRQDDDDFELHNSDIEGSDDDATVDPFEDDDAEVEEREMDEPDTIDPNFARGPVTGIMVATQGQIRMRSRRWRRLPT